MKLYIETTTDTGLWDWKQGIHYPTQPHMIRFAAILEAPDGRVVDRVCRIVEPLHGWLPISSGTFMHGMSEYERRDLGIPIHSVIARIASLAARAGTLVAHNMEFHRRVLQRTFADGGVKPNFSDIHEVCTMRSATDIVCLRHPTQNHFKWPSLVEAYRHFTNEALLLPADPIERGEALVDAVRIIHHGIIAANPLPAA